MDDFIFRLKTVFGTDIEILREDKNVTYLRFRCRKTGHEVIIDAHAMKNITAMFDKSFKDEEITYRFKNDTGVPEGYVLVKRSFFSLPPGTLLKKEDEYIILPFEPYLLYDDESFKDYLCYPS